MSNERVFVYWDNSNIFHAAQHYTAKREEAFPDARNQMRINFDNLLRLAQADRTLMKAFIAGSVPPETNKLWQSLKDIGVKVNLFNRAESDNSEQDVPDERLQLEIMWEVAQEPGTIVLLTGDGAGYEQNKGFLYTLEIMHAMKWKIEVLSWKDACNQRMKDWVEKNGVFVALDDYYDSITFMEPPPTTHHPPRT